MTATARLRIGLTLGALLMLAVTVIALSGRVASPWPQLARFAALLVLIFFAWRGRAWARLFAGLWFLFGGVILALGVVAHPAGPWLLIGGPAAIAFLSAAWLVIGARGAHRLP